jgi:c(7)-type cytochrome triheme protein
LNSFPILGRLTAVGALACLIATEALPADRAPVGLLAFLRPATGQAADPEPPREVQEHTVPAARRAIDGVEFLDNNNPDRQRLQRIDEATRHLPYDANGFPDWMRALKAGLIKPRSSLQGNAPMEVLDLDIIMRNTKEMPFVKFPHRSHTEWLTCSNCHPDPFPTKAGGTEIRMINIFRGQYCGKCHDRVAFITFFSCDRCHSLPQKTATTP